MNCLRFALCVKIIYPFHEYLTYLMSIMNWKNWNCTCISQNQSSEVDGQVSGKPN